MKKPAVLFLVLLSLLALQPNLLSQCTPGTFPTPGFYPDSITGLDSAHVGQSSYSMIMNYKSPLDTVYGGFTVPVDSFIISSITGLPPSFTYTCGIPNCVDYPNSGGDTQCWEITGDPSQAGVGVYNLTITISQWITVFGFPVVTDFINTEYSIVISAAPPPSSANLEISDSNIFIEGKGNGFILQDDEGKCWQYSTDTNGNLVSLLIACPN